MQALISVRDDDHADSQGGIGRPAGLHHVVYRRRRRLRRLWAAGIVLACALEPELAWSDPPPPQVATKEPNHRAMALFGQAREAYEKGEYRAAMAKLEEAIALDPGSAELVYNVALIHEKLGEIED